MDFAEGGQVNDREYMRKHGINVNEVREMPLSLRNTKTEHQFLRNTQNSSPTNGTCHNSTTQDRLISNFTLPMLIWAWKSALEC